jgi:predicted nucleic acid-binding protein
VRRRLYVETTIPSYLAARHSRDPIIAARQQITREWWQTRRRQFDLFVSQLVIEECRSGDADVAGRRLDLLISLPTLAANQAIIEIAEALMRNASLPANAVGDALHIAFAVEHRCDYLLTWNYRHIANANIQRAVQRTLSTHSKLPSLCTPEDLMSQSDENK